MNIKSTFLIIATALILLGCTVDTPASWTSERDPLLDKNPTQLAIKHHNTRSQIRWLGCHGFAPYLPGVTDTIKWEYKDSNIHWISGTGDDVPISPEYNQQAELFAKVYNQKRIELDNKK